MEIRRDPITWLISHPAGVALLVAAFALSPLYMRRVDPSDYTPTLGYSSEAQSSRNTSAVGRLFGEFRTSMSDVMFLKTERYLHNGVVYEAHIQDQEFSKPGFVSGEGQRINTAIRPAEGDWRGVIGDLEREVKPWLHPDIHMAHTKGAELLPWFRLMTLVNPHRIRGYRVGAFLLLTSGLPNSTQEAREFIEEGIERNPRNHELQFMMVRIFQHELLNLRNVGEGLTADEEKRFYEEMLTWSRTGIEYGAEVRPPGGWSGKGRPAEMEDSFAACLHYEIFCLQHLGRNQEALERGIQSREKFGSDPSLDHVIEELEVELTESKEGV